VRDVASKMASAARKAAEKAGEAFKKAQQR
jgi:hypothetical protein